ncbi:hypothetical protein O3U67_05940 [Brevundimonas diminuta]|uniref:hypothetical protein n=1 Tax=Brevundimonas diminuta TaxID=293 RepID=UPI0022B0289D|nr:hypothetical protein [Brevundimonas diminuta]MCZ4107610.1 hypothetical protein [Brevundimonas diminuta]
MSVEYVFTIDVFTPDTMPMARLADYLAELAHLVGHKETTHFKRVELGSAKLAYSVADATSARVEQRIVAAPSGEGPREAVEAFKRLDDMLAADNAVGSLQKATGGGVVIQFPGRLRPAELTLPAFRQPGTIDGEVVSLGGKDKTAHVILRDGSVTYSNISVTRDQAKRLAPFLYQGKVRLSGTGRWQRETNGAWKLLTFSVDDFESLDDAPLADVLSDLRAAAPRLTAEDAYNDIAALRLDDGEVH